MSFHARKRNGRAHLHQIACNHWLGMFGAPLPQASMDWAYGLLQGEIESHK